MSSNELPTAINWTNGMAPRAARSGDVRLFCLPYAGGGASRFRPWTTELSPGIAVYPIQLPGREGRWREPPLTSITALAPLLSQALGPLCQQPYALFGHSMGAFVAFELARQLRREDRPGPSMVIVSGARAPQIPDPDPPARQLPVNELLRELGRLDGVPNELLNHPEFVALLLPMLRADLSLCETYAYTDEAPLDCAVAVYGGQHDPKVPLEHLSAWKAQTTGAFRLRLFPGKHFFFLKESRAAVTQAVRDDLGPYAHRAADASVLVPGARVEQLIAALWAEVLRVPNVGLDDNFFELGGDSLLMLQTYSKLRDATSTTLSVLDLFRYPTIRLLANAMEPRTRVAIGAAEPRPGSHGTVHRREAGVQEESHHE